MTETDHPNPKLAELTERLSGHWRVTGPGIEGAAEYRPQRNDQVLVGKIEVVVDGAPMTNLQRISHDQQTDSLRARYLDTLGNEADYTWTLDGRTVRVGLADDPDTYFEARFAEDYSEYAGTWHYPDGVDEDLIVCTRVE